jgi:hypothetical protein
MEQKAFAIAPSEVLCRAHKSIDIGWGLHLPVSNQTAVIFCAFCDYLIALRLVEHEVDYLRHFATSKVGKQQ